MDAKTFFGSLLLVGLLAPPPTLHASAGTEGASFLDIPVGAGPAAMGSAYIALATDAYAPTHNPAGLGFLKDIEVAGQHLAYIQSIRYEHLGAVLPLSPSGDEGAHRGVGVSIQHVGSGDIARTDVANGVPVTGLGSYSSEWSAYNLSYGQTITSDWSVGVTGKAIRAAIDDVSATAYAADIGTLYRWSDRLTLAATAVNLGTSLTFLTDGDPLPMAVHVGGAYRATPRWLLTSEGVYRKTGLASVGFGAQWQPVEAVSLRTGYKTETLKGLDALAGLSAGLGLQVWGQELAYAWVPYGELGNAQYLSFIARFGGDKEGRRHLIRLPTKQPTIAQGDRQLTMAPDDVYMQELMR